MNKNQGDIFLQYQKCELSREEATDKLICGALKSKRHLFKQDNDDDVQGAEGEEGYYDIQGEESDDTDDDDAEFF